MRTLNELIEARAANYSFLNNASLVSPDVANAVFCTPFYGFEENYFNVYENLNAVLLFNAHVSGSKRTTTFFILQFADHWEANVGGMMEECEGDLIELFDEVCGIHDIATSRSRT